MRNKTELLDEIVEEYVSGVDDYMNNLRKLMNQESFSCDDMRNLSDIAYQLASFADEQADEFDYILDDDNRFADRDDEVMQ